MRGIVHRLSTRRASIELERPGFAAIEDGQAGVVDLDRAPLPDLPAASPTGARGGPPTVRASVPSVSDHDVRRPATRPGSVDACRQAIAAALIGEPSMSRASSGCERPADDVPDARRRRDVVAVERPVGFGVEGPQAVGPGQLEVAEPAFRVGLEQEGVDDVRRRAPRPRASDGPSGPRRPSRSRPSRRRPLPHPATRVGPVIEPAAVVASIASVER